MTQASHPNMFNFIQGMMNSLGLEVDANELFAGMNLPSDLDNIFRSEEVHQAGQNITAVINEAIQLIAKNMEPIAFDPSELVEEEDESKVCGICKVYAKSHALNCGHQYCSECCKYLSTNKKCPTCRQDITFIIKLF